MSEWEGWEICQKHWDCKTCPYKECENRKEMES